MEPIILVVDDEADVRNTIKRILISEGYDVITAQDADDMLKLLKRVKPDLILLDIMMPGTPVKNVVGKIKDIKIAYVSVVRPQQAKEQKLLQHEGVVDFLAKPLDVKFFASKIKKILSTPAKKLRAQFAKENI